MYSGIACKKQSKKIYQMQVSFTIVSDITVHPAYHGSAVTERAGRRTEREEPDKSRSLDLDTIHLGLF